MEILDPGSGVYRTVEFGIFMTLAPQVRITLDPAINPAQGEFQVLVDDGDDNTNESLDISSLFTFVNGVAVANVPATVPIDQFPGPNQDVFRALFTDPTQVRVMYYGENRIRFRRSDHDCFTAYFLCYDSFNDTVVGVDDGAESIPTDPSNQMMTNHILLNFDPAGTDADISNFLFDEQLRPQGITRDLGVVQVRDLQPLSGTALLSRIAELGSALGDPNAAYIDRLTGDPTTSGELYPPAISADYRQATADWSATGRQNHHQHFVMQTFPAHRLINLTKDGGATVRVLMPGSGVANGRDFSGPAANNPNTYFVRGNRLFQATLVGERPVFWGLGRVSVADPGDAGNPTVGDIRNVSDVAAGVGHDTAVMAVMAGDGVGDQPGGVARTINQIVLGTGKDVQIRVIQFTLSNLAYYKQLELSAADANTRIHLVERSYSTANRAEAAAAPLLDRRYTAISNAGKLIVGAAWNEGADMSTADIGRISPPRATSRADLAGADAFKKNVLSVGGTERLLTPNVLETKRVTANTGPQLSVVAPNQVLAVDKTGAMTTVSGTSFTTPLVAGIAAELMLVDPTLQQAGNILKVAEFIEATAEDVAAVGADNDTGWGRVQFWKAVLSVANGGLSAEGRTALGNGNDSYFKDLPLKNEAATTWYGFDARLTVQNAVLWFRDNLGAYAKVQDAGQARPAITNAGAGDVLTYVSTQPHRNAAGRILPFLPFSAAELTTAGVTQRFWAGFSITRDQLANQQALLAVPLGKTPDGNPEAVLFDLPLTDRTDLRRAQGATGANRDLIKATVKEFSDFVFYLDYNPVRQVQARLPDVAFTVGQVQTVNVTVKNVGTTDIPVGRFIITGQGNILTFDDTFDFGPLTAGQTKTFGVRMTCQAAGTVTLHVTVLRAANTNGDSVVATPVGGGANDSRDGTMTCTSP